MLSFDAAAAYCRNLGGYSARDQSYAGHSAVRSNVLAALETQDFGFWIGLTENTTTDASWVWVNGPALGSYRSFSTYSPGTNNHRDCVYVTEGYSDFTWQYTINCNMTLPFICQRDFTAPPIVTTTTQRPFNCPFGWTAFATKNTCIQLGTTPRTWSDARTQCSAGGGDLIRLNNTVLKNYVSTLVNAQKGRYWIGLNDRAKEGLFTWLDDRNKTTYSFWDTGMPNNSAGNENCVVTDGNRANKWDDLDCSTLNRYICQRSPNGNHVTYPPPFTPPNANCGPGWEDVTGSDSCFSFNPNLLSWQDALADCKSKGGDLASISNAQEQSYISGRTLYFPSDLMWVGANDRDTENGWQWSDGTPFAFLNWDEKQPDNSADSDCTVVSKRTSRWDDVPCGSRNGYICKKKGKVTSASLVTTTTPPAHLPADAVWTCERGWENYRGSCYKAVQLADRVNWAGARDACATAPLSGALASIIDADENKFIMSLYPSGYSNYAWIGMQDPTEGTFTWVDNTPVQYTNWQPGEPNNANNEDCVVMLPGGHWNDAQCTNAYTVFFCKKPKSIQPRAGSDELNGCTNGSIGYGALCYNFVNNKHLNFYDAQKDCKASSHNLGSLATVDSGHLQAFLAAELDTAPSATYWIGLYQSGAVYKWYSGATVDFAYWGKNHTGNEKGTCVAMQHNGLWGNYPCSATNLTYICESPRTGFTTPTTKAPVTTLLPCPTGWPAYGGSCFKAFAKNMSDQLSWTEARDYCAQQAEDGSLASIADNATQLFLLNSVIKAANITTGQFWIGLNDRDAESKYAWIDETPFLYANWAPNEPNDQLNKEDCVEWNLPANNWNDDYCSVSRNWVCQVPRGSKITTPKPVPTGASTTQCGNSSWLQYNNYCYYVSPPTADPQTWFNARDTCISLGADLASIGSEDVNGFITSVVSKNPVYAFWTGLNTLYQDSFGWSDQSPVNYVNWAENEPDNGFGGESCVTINSVGTWNDNQCQTSLGYVCRKLPGGVVVTPYTPLAPVGGCPVNFVSLPSLGYCYHLDGTLNTTRKNYTGAIHACEQMAHKAQLASIHTSLEQKFVLIMLDGLRMPAWIGLNDIRQQNKFEWIDNLIVSYTNWGPGQPDENSGNNWANLRDCVDIEVRGQQAGTWKDKSCYIPMPYVCESRKGATFPTVQPNTTGCQSGYYRFRDNCYKLFKDNYDWTGAENICKKDKGNLVTISNPFEQAFVEILTGHYNDSYMFWLGLSYDTVSTTFKSADGGPVWFTNWGPGEPKTNAGQACVAHTVDKNWKVVNCTNKYNYICEINMGGPRPSRPIPVGRCPRRNNWVNVAGNCYSIQSSSLKSWSAANSACDMLGATLASIHSDAEQRTLTPLIGKSGKDVWIGLKSLLGNKTGFTWSDATELEYNYWGAGEPNNPDPNEHQACVKIRSQDGAWADTDCFDENAYLCKMAPVPWFSTSPGSNNPGVTTRSPNQPSGAPLRGNNPDTGLGGGSVAGIVIGTLVFVALVAVITVVVVRQRYPQLLNKHTKIPPLQPGFDNATYSSGKGVTMNVTDA